MIAVSSVKYLVNIETVSLIKNPKGVIKANKITILIITMFLNFDCIKKVVNTIEIGIL